MRFNVKKHFGFPLVAVAVLLPLLLCSCKKEENRLLGKWTAENNVTSYSFEESDYSMEIDIMFTTICIKGTYRLDGNRFFTTAKQTSYDSGKTWSKNKGELIPKEEYEGTITFNEDGTITIDGLVYTRS